MQKFHISLKFKRVDVPTLTVEQDQEVETDTPFQAAETASANLSSQLNAPFSDTRYVIERAYIYRV